MLEFLDFSMLAKFLGNIMFQFLPLGFDPYHIL